MATQRDFILGLQNLIDDCALPSQTVVTTLMVAIAEQMRAETQNVTALTNNANVVCRTLENMIVRGRNYAAAND